MRKMNEDIQSISIVSHHENSAIMAFPIASSTEHRFQMQLAYLAEVVQLDIV